MALHKLGIRSERLFLDDALVGLLMMDPPGGISASMDASEDRGIVHLRLRWMVESSPGQLLPFEVLRLRLVEFYPEAAFIGGRRYERTHAQAAPEGKLGFPYNTYYKFRIKAFAPYDAALFSKMPVACWQEKHRAFALAFPKFLMSPEGYVPLFIRASGAEAVVDFTAAIMGEFEVEKKPFGWFGTRIRSGKHASRLVAGQSLEAGFLLVAADTWDECIRACMEHLYGTFHGAEGITDESLANMLGGATRFYNRVWDARNRTHVHLPVKNVPRFESVEFKHSHVTDDLTKLVLYRRLAQLGFDELSLRERELLQKLAGEAYCYGSDGCRLWHTTTYFDGTGLRAFSHHGVGLVGFPGGMATAVRRLFEYCSLASNDALESLAQSGADWLVRTQRVDGSWPARITSRGAVTRIGCVASTAEAVRALTIAHLRTENEKYYRAAEAGIQYVNRDESFFECRQYLRDVDPDEADGISAEACIHANLDWYAFRRDDRLLAHAVKWAYYALQWVRPRSLDIQADPSFDGLSRSITPRIDVWGGLLVARAFIRLSRINGEETWRDCAWSLFGNTVGLRERDGGLCETWFLDFPSGLESIHIEPTFVTDAFVEFILEAYGGEANTSLAKAVRKRRESAREAHPPLSPSGTARDLITFSKDRPEFVIDRRLRLALAFEGAYDSFNGFRRALYTMLREVVIGRKLLALVPIAKVLLNRHRISAPISKIGKAAFVEIIGTEEEDAGDDRRTRRYRTPLHEISLSLIAAGSDADGRTAADVELEVNTIAGDVRLKQVRIDLGGRYEAHALHGGEGFAVSSGGNEYSVQITDGSVDSILRDGDRLAFDISLSSNWNFFGQYRLCLRVARAS
jgi:hypothetical protein